MFVAGGEGEGLGWVLADIWGGVGGERGRTSKLVKPRTMSLHQSCWPISEGTRSQVMLSASGPKKSLSCTDIHRPPSSPSAALAATSASMSASRAFFRPSSPLSSIPSFPRKASYRSSPCLRGAGAQAGPSGPLISIALWKSAPSGGAGASRCAQMDMLPALSPKTVTLLRSPPKPCTNLWIHFSAFRWSFSAKFAFPGSGVWR